MKLRFLKFKKEDFEEYKSWYKKKDLNRELGPIDQEWLDAVLKQKDGQEFSVFNGNELVAVAGIKFSDSEHNYYVITDIAVKPGLQNKGIGSQVLQDLIKMHSLGQGQFWRTFINTRNTKAKLFLEKNGWICKSKKPDKNGMMEFEFNK